MLALPSSANLGADLMNEYYDLLASGNYESASYMWQKASLARSQRFGIAYDKISLKTDCNSPIVRNLEYLKKGMYSPYSRVEGLGKGYVKVHYSAKIGTDTIGYTYFAANDGKYLWLVYPQDYYGRTWDVVESEFLRIHVHFDKTKSLNPVVLEAADQFIRNTADSLQLSPTDLALLKANKIEYYYCDSTKTVGDISGTDTEGTFDMASDDIISARFPHFHELVHFLVAFKLRVQAMYTLPIMREGVAVMYGGRWGRSASSLYALGAFVYQNQLVAMDSLLTMDGFAALSGADVNYPVAGILSAFLKDKLGIDGYFKVYRALSTDYDSLHAMTADQVKTRMAAAAGYADWAALQHDFEAYLTSFATAHGDVAAGDVSGSSLLKNKAVEVKDSKDWITVVAHGDTAAPIGTILFGKDQRLNGSDLFALQFSEGVPFEGYRYAIRWDANEAGLYDYATNQITAKYILGVTPDSLYYTAVDKKLAIRFKKALFNNIMPNEADARILAQ
jgi:hypothetical protein